MTGKLALTGASLLFVLATLAGCGGGGGGESSAAAPPSTQSAVAAAPANVPRFAYAANSDSGNVSAYSIDASTGALAQVAGSPFAAGSFPQSITTTGTIQ